MLVDIREFYADDAGDERPGKKGVALAPDQWRRLLELAPRVDRALRSLQNP